MINIVVRHIESHLGRIDSRAGCWRFPLNGHWLQVIAFANRPRRDSVTLCTLGLSHTVFSGIGCPVRYEVVTACRREDAADGRIASLMMTVGEVLVGHQRGAVEGDLFGPFGAVMTDAGLADYAMARTPAPYRSSFDVCRKTEPNTRFVWLAPVTAAEASVAAKSGPESLHKAWLDRKTDLLDWRRGG